MQDDYKSNQGHALDQFENMLRQVLNLLEWSKTNPDFRWILECFIFYAPRFMKLGEMAQEKKTIDVASMLARFWSYVRQADPYGEETKHGVFTAITEIFSSAPHTRRRRPDPHQLTAFLYMLGFDPGDEEFMENFKLANPHLVIPDPKHKLGDGKPTT